MADKGSDKLMIIPRVYTNKPRTTGDGYKGMLHQPDKAPDLLAGIIAIRKMHMRVMQETGPLLQMRCFILKIAAIWMIFSPTKL